MTDRKKEFFGFGFNPFHTESHFLVIIPDNIEKKVLIYERTKWSNSTSQFIYAKKDRLKAELTLHKWSIIADPLKNEYNKRLKKSALPLGNWKTGQNPLEKLFGKELLLLIWAVEDADPSLIPIAIRNWLGLSPEERWWLYTMTNASTGNVNDKKGWRKAIRFALTENPIDETKLSEERGLLQLAVAKSSKGRKGKGVEDLSQLTLFPPKSEKKE